MIGSGLTWLSKQPEAGGAATDGSGFVVGDLVEMNSAGVGVAEAVSGAGVPVAG
jgi:hypothetical protein